MPLFGTISWARQCVRSGYCCKKVPCPYGEWNENKTACKYLQELAKVEGNVLYKCERYEYIIKQKGSDVCPAFGAGCSSSLFNKDRDSILIRMMRTKSKTVHEYIASEGGTNGDSEDNGTG